jgi:hypothetical protein
VPLTRLDFASWASGAHNEDAIGCTPASAWVIDGATGTGGPRMTNGPTDAAWLAQTLHSRLQEQGPQRVDAMLNSVERQIAADFQAQLSLRGIKANLVDQADAPTACLALLSWDADHRELDVACLGDVFVLAFDPHRGLHVITDRRLDRFTARTMQQWRQHSTGGLQTAPAAVQAIIKENRRNANQPDGYGIVHPMHKWADQAIAERLNLSEGSLILLSTDGLWRLVETFEVYSPAQLLKTVYSRKSAFVLQQLRTLERMDPHGQVHPRIKASDDATLGLWTV